MIGTRRIHPLIPAALALLVAAGCGEKPSADNGGGGGGTNTDGPKKSGSALEGSSTSAADAPAPVSFERPAITGHADPDKAAGGDPDKAGGDDPNLVAIELALPKPAFKGTPKNVPPGTRLKKTTGKRRPPFLAPKDVKVMSLNRPVTSSDMDPIIGTLDLVTDGDKEATEGSYVELGPGKQWVQMDLGRSVEIFAVVFWFYHGDSGRVYHDVILQFSDEPDFILEPKTVFNNDHDNSAGLGIGQNYEFFELFDGNLVDCTDGKNNGTKARYVRLYVNGSTADELARFTEVEVHGRPAH